MLKMQALLMGLILATTGCALFNKKEAEPKPLHNNLQTAKITGALATELKELAMEDEVNTDIYRPLVYVKMNNHSTVNSDLLENYIMSAIQKMGFFDQVVTKSPTAYINVKPNEVTETPSKDLWYEKIDTQSLRDIRQIYGADGPFLVAEATMRDISSSEHYFSNLPSWDHDVVFDLKLIDPLSGHTLFYLNNKDNNYNGVNLNMIDPVILSANKWLRKHAASNGELLPIPKLRGSRSIY